MYYELATLTLPFGATGQAAAQAAEFAKSVDARGQLLGCWSSDIGELNRLIVLRGFQTLDDLEMERQRTQLSANPLGCGNVAHELHLETYRGFPWMAPVLPSEQSGVQGPIYEIRTYGIQPGGVQPTIDLWQQYLPARHALSPCVVAMVALDGPLRFTNIWAYPTLNARSQTRADAVAQGLWPPKGGPAHLRAQMMTSTIAVPTSVSPLQ